MLTFEWDEKKADINKKKHDVSFVEAETAFYDPNSITIPDPDHSENKSRFIDIGLSNRNKLLVIAYTERGDNIRIISARKATAKENVMYEQER